MKKHRQIRATLVGAALALSTLCPAKAANANVTMQAMAFSPTELSIAAGDTVIFANTDNTSHDVISTTNDIFDLGLQKAGQSASHSFAKPGVYAIVCKFHPKMRMTVNVK